MILKDKKILLGVSSSVAIYKSLEIIRLLKKEEAEVFVVMTKNAKKLISPLLFSALSGKPTFWEMFSNEQRYPHLELVKDISLFLIAPATANIISKIANGIADDLLTTSVLSCKAPIVIAPAMNVNMWEKEIIQRNLDSLRKNGFFIIEPEEGELGCGEKGKGRMADPQKILNFVKALLFTERKKIKFVITGGATESSIDKIRIITNRASGLLSVLLAEVCYQLGYQVTLILGRSEYYPTLPIKVIRAFTNKEMLEEIKKEIDENTCLIMNAAPCDYKVKETFPFKVKNGELELKLVRDIDILKELSDKKLLCKIGFSCDVKEELKEGERKLKEKALSLCVINPSETIGSENIKATLLFEDGKKKELPLMAKKDFAFKLIEEVELWLKEKHPIPQN
ncbi:MAG: bifunctional phosphopantothenoylcysteine decarboxylase/phosphopantothenate--cysteine ligase CoaBC [candidate division WOR-3 bacterium]|nr:bifunctional phosphopantothenoylcysteine decarboxylase/phosphopantothenate--cysteine ligase CoaBC [candidate division WOR-3 bacterium]MCX7836788.1 bifunctional phosphopantothenoylcysteine decarboxylase/phosphopantothenate--cysteine ligase CoaBC [candidate division WOR-3 bacterium]MDW8113574.1 bifunctional phosphopantothenoylcysteine decarboxylase/phosphopantothenate--cysteine ligase CoaBC [candidate division WOR-3 bacterium]